MSYRDFRHSTPAYIRLLFEAHDEEVRDRSRLMQMQSWMIGTYVMAAIGATFGKSKYPENPLVKEMQSVSYIAKQNGKTEEELNNELLMATLMVQQANAQIASTDAAMENTGEIE